MERPFGMSNETESSWPDALSEAHANFILTFMEAAQAHEAAVIERLLESKER
jgi:hypothetical protein